MTATLAMLHGYRRSWLHGGLIGGVTVIAHLVRRVMAYATVAGLNPVAGSWAAPLRLVISAQLGFPSLSMRGADELGRLLVRRRVAWER